jgi:hypothetical protein
VSAVVGLMLGVLTTMSFAALTQMDVAGMLWVWTGAFLGMRIDGFVMTDYVGQIPILFVTFVLLRALLSAGSWSRSPDVSIGRTATT